jgi:hypothetical protein
VIFARAARERARNNGCGLFKNRAIYRSVHNMPFVSYPSANIDSVLSSSPVTKFRAQIQRMLFNDVFQPAASDEVKRNLVDFVVRKFWT